MINLKVLDEKLEKISGKHTTPKLSVTALTSDIKLLFAEMFSAKDKTFCYANGITPNDYSIIHGDNEFIFDFIVVEEELEADKMPSTNIRLDINYITDVVLALESEFHGGLYRVVEDFQKLITCNASEKVIVFRCHSTEYVMWQETLLEHVKNYKKSNGLFHFIAKLNNQPKFERRSVDVNGWKALL